MRSRHQLLAPHDQSDAWPSPDRIYLVFGLDRPNAPSEPDAVIAPASHLRHPALRQPDAGLLGDLVAHHPPVRGLLLLLRADLADVLASLDRAWSDLGADWNAVAASLLQGPRAPLITLHDLDQEQRALLGEAPHVVRHPDGTVQVLDRATRERWRADLTADLALLFGRSA